MNQEKLYQKMRQTLREPPASLVPLSTDDPMVFDEQAELNLVLWGDPQVSYIMPMRGHQLSQVCHDLANAKGTADALVLLGDLTEYGMESEYRTLCDILSVCSDKFDRLLCIPGNHDVRLRPYKKQVRKFQRFLQNAPKGVCGDVDSYFQVQTVKGYTFILLGTDRATFEGAYFGTEQLRKFEQALAAANGKPVFVFNHQTLKRTNGLPHTWLGKGKWRGSVGRDSDKLKAILEKYKNVFYISGHLHWETNPYSFEDHGSYKALSVPAVGPYNHGTSWKDPQSYVLSVYKDRVVAKARLCMQGKYMDSCVPNAEIVIPLD